MTTIRTQDLDPTTLQAVMSGIGEAMQAAKEGTESHEALSSALKKDARRFQMPPHFIAGGIAGTFGAFGVGVLLGHLGIVPMQSGYLLGAGLFLVGLLATFVLVQRWASVLHADLLAAFLPHIALGRPERAYCEVLTLLARPDLGLQDEVVRSTLGRMNTLMTRFRELDDYRSQVQVLAGTDAIQRLETERQELAGRLHAASPPEGAADLETSLRLCERRLESARSLAASAGQIEARQELMIQTLGSIQANLSTLVAAGERLQTPEVDEIHQQLERMAADARATEAAVQEVLLVSRSG